MNIMRTVFSFLLVTAFALPAWSQHPPCDIPAGIYCTQTQGGWGQSCSPGNHNPGCIMDANFNNVFPNGLIIGGTYTIFFTHVDAVEFFLPASSTPGVLFNNYVNPTTPPGTEAGIFAAQVMTLAVNVAFANAGVSGSQGIGHLVIPTGMHTPTGPFAGYTINQLLALGNTVLGGNLAALPAGISLSDLNSMINLVNNNFVRCLISNDVVVEPDCDEILPVEIAAFWAAAAGNTIVVNWTTAAEQNILQYTLERSENASPWHSVARIAGQGNSPTGFSYSFADTDVRENVVYSYRLTVHEADGSTVVYPQVASASLGGAAVPSAFALHQNYPNPFNPSTTIAFDVAEPVHVRLAVLDVLGREIALLVNESRAPNSYTVSFSGAGLPSGIYLCRLEAGDFATMRKLMLIK